jgi:hypothetical protein
MDNFYVVRVKWLKDGTIKKSELMSYEKKEQAIAKYHSNMATDMVDETLSGSMCTVLDALGGCVLNDYWGSMTVNEEENSETEEQN